MAENDDNVLITIKGGVVTWTMKRKPPVKPEPQKASPYQNAGYRNLERCRRRRINNFAANVNSMAEMPKWFLSLNFDYAAKREWRHDECAHTFKIFTRFLDRQYPGCWFHYFMDYSPIAGIHFHLIGTFGEKGRKWEEVAQKWLTLTGSQNESMFDFRRYEHFRHLGYLTSPEKRADTLHVMNLVGKKSFCGRVNIGNMQLCEEREISLTLEDWDLFSSALLEQLVTHGAFASSLARMNKICGCLNYCTPAMITQALAAIKKGHSVRYRQYV